MHYLYRHCFCACMWWVHPCSSGSYEGYGYWWKRSAHAVVLGRLQYYVRRYWGFKVMNKSMLAVLNSIWPGSWGCGCLVSCFRYPLIWIHICHILKYFELRDLCISAPFHSSFVMFWYTRCETFIWKPERRFSTLIRQDLTSCLNRNNDVSSWY